MLYQRQKVLLSLLEALGGEAARTDFQKLLYLLTREEAVPSYDFVPYKFGCFSFTSYADKRKLTESGLLAADDKVWRLVADTGAIDAALKRRVRDFVSRHSQRGRDLVRYVYERHPHTAWRSEILADVVRRQETLEKIQAARPVSPGAGLVSLGYEGKSLETYLNQLLRGSVTTLCDVRRNPLSRKYGFSKGALSHACEQLGIHYAHLPELGISSDQRQELNTQADYDALFAHYEKNELPNQDAAVIQIGQMITTGGRVALTCYEALPQQCHRHCVAKAVESRLKRQAVKTLHL